MSEVTKFFDFKDVKPEEVKKLYSRVTPAPNGCLEWQGSILRTGYGQVKFKGRVTRAHRIFFFIANPKADQSKLVLHKCNNKKCCNIKHLAIGTHAENMFDAQRSGLLKTKLNTSIVCSIRDLYSTGRYSQAEIARMFKIRDALVWSVVHRKNWKFI